MKRVIDIDGVEHELLELDIVLHHFIFVGVFSQLIIIMLNMFVFHNVGVSCFTLGMGLTFLMLAIISLMVARHNGKIFQMVLERIEEEEKKKAVKSKRPRKKKSENENENNKSAK